MNDIFESAKVLCPECNTETERTLDLKEGFEFRALTCRTCKKTWHHPLDVKRYTDYQNLRNKEFRVKLRMVGNSHTISIPKEIIDFEDRFRQLEQEVDDMIRLTLDEPGKVSIFFRRVKGKFY